MMEEIDKSVVESGVVANREQDLFTCNSCGRETEEGYFYCGECHRIHRGKQEEDKVQNKETVNQIAK